MKNLFRKKPSVTRKLEGPDMNSSQQFKTEIDDTEMMIHLERGNCLLLSPEASFTLACNRIIPRLPVSYSTVYRDHHARRYRGLD
jgi:hypothetical protein